MILETWQEFNCIFKLESFNQLIEEKTMTLPSIEAQEEMEIILPINLEEALKS